MAVESIAKTLGTGSGIDIGALVTSLVDAQYAAKTATLDKRDETLTAQVSAVSSLKNAITGFSTALNTLARSGSLSTQPTSSNAAVVKASTVTGATVTPFTASLEVQQIAQAQSAYSAVVADPAAALGGGTFTLTFGKAVVDAGAMQSFAAGSGSTFTVTIDPTKSSLNDVAAALNASPAGVTANVLGEGDGARLVLKGPTGESLAFTLTASAGSSDGLKALAIAPGATGTSIGTVAQDAKLRLDGVPVQRTGNSISGLVPGVKLDLLSASPGAAVTLGSAPQVAAVSQAVDDFVATFNEMHAVLREATDAVNGPLRGDGAAAALKRQMSQLASTVLVADAPAGSPRTLAEIGVATNRDGTLRLDTAKLTATMLTNPAAVEAMFKPGAGLPAALGAIATAASNRESGLGASEQRYAARQSALSEERAKATSSAETMRARMLQQFASMDSKVAAYKSTQTFLEQQVDAWNQQS